MIRDGSGNRENGTVNGAIFTTNRFGQTNSAVYFNDDTISTSFFPPLGTSSRTFSGWFNTISSPQMTFLAYGGGLPTAGDRFELGIISGNMYLDVDGGTLRTANYNDGDWHQFAFVVPTNGSLATVNCFVDGILQTNTTYDSDTSVNTVGSDPLVIGELYLTGYERYFVGSLDDLRIYSRALATNEVAQLYADESVPTATPPVITGQPASQTVNQGSPASFSVTASGAGLNYQWQFNATMISGATNADYAIASATTNNAGNYDVVVSSAGGQVMSSNAVLTVIPAPRAATGTATLTGNFVTGITIFDGGSGYTNTPVVRLIGGGGSGAEAFAVVSNGTLISITVTNAGYGYTNAPVVVIDPPFIFSPVLGIARYSFLVFSNLTVGDPGGVTPLKIAGPGSVTITSVDSWATRAGSGWNQVAGWYAGGFAWQSANAGDTVTVKYSCQFAHNLYWGTALSTVGGAISALVDGSCASGLAGGDPGARSGSSPPASALPSSTPH